jgi:hypothetical protein
MLYCHGQQQGAHMKKAAIVTAVIVGLTFSAPPASAQVCVAGIIVAAFYASATANRELTATEAATCGLFYGAGVDANKAASASKGTSAKAKQPRKTAAKPQ